MNSSGRKTEYCNALHDRIRRDAIRHASSRSHVDRTYAVVLRCHNTAALTCDNPRQPSRPLTFASPLAAASGAADPKQPRVSEPIRHHRSPSSTSRRVRTSGAYEDSALLTAGGASSRCPHSCAAATAPIRRSGPMIRISARVARAAWAGAAWRPPAACVSRRRR